MKLLAAPVAQLGPDDRGDGDEVVQRERGRTHRISERRILAGQHQRIVPGLPDVGVDPGQEVPGVSQNLGRERGGVLSPMDLVAEVLLGVRRTRPRRLIQADVGTAGEGAERALAHVAQDIHHEQPILGAGPADGELELGARVAVDVRHPEGLVALNRGPRLGVLCAGHVSGRDPERGVLVELADLGRLDVRGRRGQPRVHLELIGPVGRAAIVVGLIGQHRGHVVQRPLAGREDVVEVALAVKAVGLDAGAGGCGQAERDQADNHDCAHHLPQQGG